MQVPVEALSMKKSERRIIRLFSELSMKKRNRVVDVLNDIVNDEVEKKVEKENNVELWLNQKLENEKKEDDGTRGDCDPDPFVTKEQLDRELDEYIQSNPRFLAFQGCNSLQDYLIQKNKFKN